MKIKIIGILPLAALLMTGCMVDVVDEVPQQGAREPMRDDMVLGLTTAVASQVETTGDTRAATDIHSGQFAVGESFYAYFPSGIRIGSSESAASTTFAISSIAEGVGITTPVTQPYFAAGSTSTSVFAYYPATHTQTADSFTVLADQTSETNYKASDLMYATTSVNVDKTTQTSATAALTFTHKMAKIIVSATASTGVTAIKKIRIVNGYRTVAIVNPMTTNEATTPFFGATPTYDTAITAADNGCVKLYEDATGAATVNSAALIPPQTITGSFLQVVTNEGTATYSLTDKVFAGGSSYAYTINVSLAALNVTTDITDWTGGTGATLVDNGSETLTPSE